MKAEFVRTDSQDDVEKLFSFFEEMKIENENFFFDIDVGTDEDGVLEQPRTKHDERTKDGIDTESARGQT